MLQDPDNGVRYNKSGQAAILLNAASLQCLHMHVYVVGGTKA